MELPISQTHHGFGMLFDVMERLQPDDGVLQAIYHHVLR